MDSKKTPLDKIQLDKKLFKHLNIFATYMIHILNSEIKLVLDKLKAFVA